MQNTLSKTAFQKAIEALKKAEVHPDPDGYYYAYNGKWYGSKDEVYAAQVMDQFIPKDKKYVRS